MSMRWEEPETLPRIPVYRAVGSLRAPSHPHHRPVPAGGAGLAEMEGASSDGRRKEEEEEEEIR